MYLVYTAFRLHVDYDQKYHNDKSGDENDIGINYIDHAVVRQIQFNRNLHRYITEQQQQHTFIQHSTEAK